MAVDLLSSPFVHVKSTDSPRVDPHRVVARLTTTTITTNPQQGSRRAPCINLTHTHDMLLLWSRGDEFDKDLLFTWTAFIRENPTSRPAHFEARCEDTWKGS
jgi:hypothetical protein